MPSFCFSPTQWQSLPLIKIVEFHFIFKNSVLCFYFKCTQLVLSSGTDCFLLFPHSIVSTLPCGQLQDNPQRVLAASYSHPIPLPSPGLPPNLCYQLCCDAHLGHVPACACVRNSGTDDFAWLLSRKTALPALGPAEPRSCFPISPPTRGPPLISHIW